MDASREVVEWAGGAWDASLNSYERPDTGWVTTVQVDDVVYMVGPERFDVTRHRLDDWLAYDQTSPPELMECDDARQAWELIRLLREDCLLWQCGACDAWIYTSNRPRIGVLNCSTCGDGGVDFRHADRHVGD